ncbi:MAG TPA: LamG domain-containing protein, partial [Friedmanniella sp.]
GGSAATGTFASRYWRCDTVILADAPRIYYKLNETGTTTTAADSSGNARDGTYQGTVTKGVASPCTRDGGTAVTFAGTNRYVSLATSLTVPTTISLEARFKTTSSSTTGLIVGFGASATGASLSTDRVVYLATGGRVVFGMNNLLKTTIASTASYNDGTWHHVLATAGPDGMRLYVDGAQVATSSATFTATYNGCFRVGYDSLTGWTPAASSGQFLGSVDEAAVYTATLSAADALEHYRAAT